MATNGSFETGTFEGWRTIGNNEVVDDTFGTEPFDGEFQALASTGPGSSGGPVEAVDIERFLNLAPNTLSSLGDGFATEGSAIKQTIFLEAGSTVSFATNFLTNEGTPTFFNDFSFATLTPITLKLDDTESDFEPSNTEFFEETGYDTTTFVVGETGDYLLGFGVLDLQDEIVNSAVLIDNITVTGPSEIEPPPPELVPPDRGMTETIAPVDDTVEVGSTIPDMNRASEAQTIEEVIIM